MRNPFRYFKTSPEVIRLTWCSTSAIRSRCGRFCASVSVFGGPSSTQNACDAGSVLLFVVGMAAANIMGCGNRAVQSCSAGSQRAATSDLTNSLGPRPTSDASVSDGRLGALCCRARPAEILVVDPHAMEGHGHSAGEGDLRPSRSLAPSDPHRPCLHSRPPRRWTENNIRRLEERGSRFPVAHFADPADAVDLAGLMASRREPQIGANRP